MATTIMTARARGALAALVLAGAAHVAHAEAADIAALTAVIEKQPPDLDRSAWKEKRRDAARKLGQSKDRRAVPELVHLVETETFDIIGEIAMEGLGNLGDPAAVPALQKVANDTTRDKATRELAKKTLGKLGAAPTNGPTATPGPTTGPGPTVVPVPTPTPHPTGGPTKPTSAPVAKPTPPPTPTPTPTPTPDHEGLDADRPPVEAGTDATIEGPGRGDAAGATTLGGGLLGDRPAVVMPAGPVLPDDTLAAYDRLTFAGGTASLGYDSVRKRSAFDADVTGSWAHRVERQRMAYGWTTGAHVVAGYLNPEARAVARGLQLNLTGTGEIRFYGGSLYGIGKAAVSAQVNYLANIDDDNPDQDVKDTRLNADVQVALGGGYGRVLDVGGAIRVRRLVRTLDAARALGKPIDAATARRLQLAWWAVRGHRSQYDALTATVAILREAGVLLGEPDAGLAFELINVLRDSQLFLRPSGFDAQVVIGEGYLRRPPHPDGQSPPAGEEGRVEQLLASAAYGKQLADDTLEVSGGAHARLRLFAPSNPPQPSPWAIGVGGRVRRFSYGSHGDPYGALDVTLDLQLSDDDPLNVMNQKVGLRVAGELGYTYWLNQASGIRLAASVAEDGGEVFFGAKLSATYGLLDGTFAGL